MYPDCPILENTIYTFWSGTETLPSMDMYQLPGGEDKNGPRIIGSIAIQQPDAAASQRIL